MLAVAAETAVGATAAAGMAAAADMADAGMADAGTVAAGTVAAAAVGTVAAAAVGTEAVAAAAAASVAAAALVAVVAVYRGAVAGRPARLQKSKPRFDAAEPDSMILDPALLRCARAISGCNFQSAKRSSGSPTFRTAPDAESPTYAMNHVALWETGSRCVANPVCGARAES